ncbi:MAG: Gfo/Idh/MocA family oxidoreductase [Armatimonadetes bacterium]|nr:Gfo/Idh/MocA family oxidoreductase [Armatimonadota bacterium]
MPDPNVLLVGCGGIGGVHLERWSKCPGAKVLAVCDTDAAAAQKAADQVGAAAFTDLAEALKTPGLNVADICTPPVGHSEAALAAIGAGLHVLCEKPLARTPHEAQQIYHAAAAAQRLLMTAFCHRFEPGIVYAKRLLEEGKLGSLVMIRNRFSGLFTGVEDRWFSKKAIAGGGTLLDTAIHSIDIYRFLAGEVVSVSGRVTTHIPGIDVEDTAIVLLQAESGALGVIEASWATPGGRNIVEIYGTAGACFVDYNDGSVTVHDASTGATETVEPGAGDRFQSEVNHFAECVRTGAPPAVTGHDGLRAVEIAAEVYAQNGL